MSGELPFEKALELVEASEKEDFRVRFAEASLLINTLLRVSSDPVADLDELYGEYGEHEKVFWQSRLSDEGRRQFVATYLDISTIEDARDVHNDIVDPVVRIRSNVLFLERGLTTLEDVLESGKRDATSHDVEPIVEAEIWQTLSEVAAAYGERQLAAEYETKRDWAQARIAPRVERAITELLANA